jgi:glutamyl-tRNA reductase
MALVALTVNHKTAPVEFRERVSFAPEKIGEALHGLVELPTVKEVAILSTCNRTELYCGIDGDVARPVVDWLGNYHNLHRKDLVDNFLSFPDQEAVRHILRVAAGLDSLILGEPQILGQMKDAFQSATQAGTLGTSLNKLFQHTFSVAKQVRTDTAIGSSPVSVAFAAVSLAKQIFDDLSQQTVLLIGAGETIELAARHLHQNGIGRMIVANRTVDRAHTLAAEFQGFAIGLSELEAHLHEADIIISSTGSQEPILKLDAVKRALKVRKHRPMFMVDIAVPRDIEERIGKLEDVYLYTVDDLTGVIEENIASRQEAARQAEEIIDTQVSHFMGWLRSLDAVGSIRDLRSQADVVRAEILNKARANLATGKDPEEVLQWLAHTLTNKLLHSPSAKMRQAAYDGRNEFLDAARELLSIDK